MFSTDNASFKAKNIRAGSPDLFMSMGPSKVPEFMMLTTDPGSGARGHIIHTPLNFKKENRNRWTQVFIDISLIDIEDFVKLF